MSATVTKGERLQAQLDELRGLLDENGVAPSSSATPDTIRLVKSLSYYGLTWTEAVHRVGGVTKQEYNAKQKGDPIDRLRELAIDGVAPSTAIGEGARVYYVLRRQGVSWDKACQLAGCKPRGRKRRNGSPEPQATSRDISLEAPTAPDTGYRGEFKQCRNCYWHDHNGYCPAPRGRCYKAPHKSVDYGTFSKEVTA